MDLYLSCPAKNYHSPNASRFSVTCIPDLSLNSVFAININDFCGKLNTDSWVRGFWETIRNKPILFSKNYFLINYLLRILVFPTPVSPARTTLRI